MSDRLAAAQAAMSAGRRDEAVGHLIAAVDEDSSRALQVYRVLVMQLYAAGRFVEGETYAAKALERYPRDYDLLNVRGVLLRKLQRQAEAVPVLELASRINPKHPAALQNLGNVLFDLNEPARAEAVFTRLVRSQPRDAEVQRQLGRCLAKQGKVEPALARLRQAVALKRENVDGWLDLVGLLSEEQRTPEAQEALEKALAVNPGERRLLEANVLIMRRSGQSGRALAFVQEQLKANPNAGWLHFQLGTIIGDEDRQQANVHLTRALELEPGKLEYATALVESLERTRTGDEAANIERSHQLARQLMARKLEFTPATTKVITETFVRVCDFDAIDQVGDFRSLGRAWAESGRHTALLKQLARVRTDADRLELQEQHRAWGRQIEAAAARRPIRRPPPRPAGGKIRLGFMSSDLRAHPVGYFALPLFDHLDRDRFEVFIYSYFRGQEDPVQRAITQMVTAYRWWPDASIGESAQKIAADQLDILIELGASTAMNKPEVMAYRPAPIQASWLGYPHSVGLETIDYLVCDPHNLPPRRELLIEKPMLMPDTWLSLGERFFSNSTEIVDGLPEERNGYFTFGTANNPHKYSREVLRAWARIVAATPNSRFAFIRPEGGSPSFRANIERQFAAEGVGADRLTWNVVRGLHLPCYNGIDISLDPFPLTGGTTTTESLWMGVPVVSLRGEAFYERLSASILTNSGLPDLVADDLDGYTRIALDLAADRTRRLELRRTLRTRLRQSPLGQTEKFAKDFYDLVARTVRG